MDQKRVHTYDVCAHEETNMTEVMTDPGATSPYLYATPSDDAEIYKSGNYPDSFWPDPYKGVFDHVRDGVAWEASDDEAFFITDLSSSNECKNQLEYSQIDYINSCYNAGIIPNKNFFLHLHDKNITMRNQGIDCDEIQAMCKLLSENLTVTSLDVSENNIKDQGAIILANLLQENDIILDLDISYNDIGDVGCCRILESLAKTGFILNFSGNKITDRSLPAIADAIKEEGKIKTLLLSNNKLGQFPAEPEKCFQAALASNWSLEKLDLSWNNFNGNQAQRLLIGIKENQSISWLDLSHNGLCDKECPNIVKCLKNNHNLQYLDISGNFLTSECAKNIAKGIKLNETLTVLKIGQNYIDDVGSLALLQAVITNERSGLQVLDMGETRVNASFMTLMEKMDDRQIEITHGPPIRSSGFKDRPWNKLLEKYANAPKKGKEKDSKKK